MKKTISLMIIFLGLSFITSAKNFSITDLNALPGMPVLHDEDAADAYHAQRNAFDSSYAMIFARMNADSIQSYIKQLQRQGHRYMYSPGQKSISVWVNHNLSISYSSANRDSVQLSYTKPEGGMRICMTLMNGCVANKNGMLSAHSFPKIIFHPGSKAKAAPQNTCLIRDNIHATNLWMAGMTHTIAFLAASTEVLNCFLSNHSEMLSVFTIWSEKTEAIIILSDKKMLG
ncbi:MAG: hypothetical protein WCL06_15090 [Bacteroidota bacterium]